MPLDSKGFKLKRKSNFNPINCTLHRLTVLSCVVAYYNKHNENNEHVHDKFHPVHLASTKSQTFCLYLQDDILQLHRNQNALPKGKGKVGLHSA